VCGSDFPAVRSHDTQRFDGRDSVDGHSHIVFFPSSFFSLKKRDKQISVNGVNGVNPGLSIHVTDG
jgi:hypothetical protein